MKPRRPHRTTVPRAKPPRRVETPRPTATPRPAVQRPPRVKRSAPRRTAVASIVDDSDKSLVDVIDSLLNQGVMLNADIILALADVDLVYLRLSALLCAADRVLPPPR
jgi:hypothetical protein